MSELGAFGREHPAWAVLAVIVVVAGSVVMVVIKDRGRTQRRAIAGAERHGPELLRAVLERLGLCGPRRPPRKSRRRSSARQRRPRRRLGPADPPLDGTS
ncbi:MAG TPA: hypothetical protein VGJ44_27130 [Kribbellaceae bacterium]|jgi:hypothetical protein